MASWSAVASGNHAVTTGTTHLFVDVVALPSGVSVGQAAPSNYYGVGLLRLGFRGSYRSAIPIDAFATLIDVPADTDIVAWHVFSPGSVTVTEYPSGATPPPGGFVQDSFTDVDGTAVSAHTPEHGGAWGSPNTDLFISGGKATSTDYPDSSEFNFGTPPGDGNYSVSCDIVCQYSTATSAMVWARQAAGLNGYAGRLSGDGSVSIFRDYFTELASGTLAGFTLGTTYRLMLKCSGTDLSLSVDGVELLTITDSTYADGDCGFGMTGGNIGAWTFDNFEADAP